MKTFTAIILAVVLSGCRFWGVDYDPQPQRITDKEQAKAVLTKTLLEQHRRNGVQGLVVHDDRITFFEERNNFATLGAMGSSMAIYFTRVNEIRLFRHVRTDTYNIDLYNKVKIYAVRCFTREDAERFVDAFVFMQKLNGDKTLCEK